MMDVKMISGVEEYATKQEKVGEKNRTLYMVGEKVFLVENKNTIEVRCDRELAKLLQAKYESVMESRYFGRGGIEIVMSGQLEKTELEDLVRLSYNLSRNTI